MRVDEGWWDDEFSRPHAQWSIIKCFHYSLTWSRFKTSKSWWEFQMFVDIDWSANPSSSINCLDCFENLNEYNYLWRKVFRKVLKRCSVSLSGIQRLESTERESSSLNFDYLSNISYLWGQILVRQVSWSVDQHMGYPKVVRAPVHKWDRSVRLLQNGAS